MKTTNIQHHDHETETTSALMLDLRKMGVRLRVEKGKLLYEAAPGSLTNAAKEKIKANRDSIISHLTRPAKKNLSQDKSKPNIIKLVTGQEPTIFCIHSVSGGATIYDRISLCDEKNRPFAMYGLCATGVNLECKPIDNIEYMAKLYGEQIQAIQPKGPYFLLGYSLGGLIAYEIAHLLKTAGQEVAMLFMIDSRIPANPDNNLMCDSQYDKELWATFINIIVQNMEWNKIPQDHKFWTETEECRISFIFDLANRGHITFRVPHANMEELQKRYNFFCKMEAARSTYRPKPYLGQVTFFYANEDNPRETWQKWTKVAKGKFTDIPIPGTHNSLFENSASLQKISTSVSDILISMNSEQGH